MFVIGITGGVGSGKSLVAKLASKKYNAELENIKQIVVFSKTDLVDNDNLKTKISTFMKETSIQEYMSISSFTREVIEELKKKIEFICDFCNTKPTIINGNIRNITRSNLSYVEPHRIIIKGITFVAFNCSNVKNMTNYRQLKKEQENNKQRLNELNYKANNLQNKSNQITEIIDYLKPNKLNKDNYTISKNDIEEIKNYIEQTYDTTTNLKNTNDLTTILEKYEEDLKNHSNEVKNLQRKIKTRNDRIEDLRYALEAANDTIDELEDKVSKLEETLDFFKDLWERFIDFLKDKFFSSNKYDDIINDLYDEGILDDSDIEVIQNNKTSDKIDDFKR